MNAGKWGYGLLFVVVLPAALVLWARGAEASIHLPAPTWPVLGGALAFGGIVLLAEAMRELWSWGGGPPMNAFPPPRLVTGGVYAVVPHPIYVGFVAACFGVALACGSAAGLWLVSPGLAVSCAALVLGYEGPALRKRFAGAAPAPWIHAPSDGPEDPTISDRVSVYLLLFAPWAILYEGIGHVRLPDAIEMAMPGERSWAVLPWTTFVYSSTYLFVLATPLAARTRGQLHSLFWDGVVATILALLAYVAIPVSSPPLAFDIGQLGGWLLAIERTDGLDGAAALPAFHVIWAMLAARAWARLGGPWGIAAWLWTAAIAISCVTTGMHRVADLAAAVPVYLLASRRELVWAELVSAAERVANSWREWRLGPVRIISHAGFAGAAAAVGVALAGTLIGTAHAWAAPAVALCSLVGAGLWGQALVGSRTLLRPFGYFGAVLGAVIGIAAASAAGALFWVVAGAFAAASPWVVLIGRFRCLVQGCCHGCPIEGSPGIHYRHPRSRVSFVSRLAGVPLHATPVYSMLCNIVVGALLARLWSVGAGLSLIAGLYLLLSGIGRFVEESRRGESQTQTVGGLRIYQWFAVLSAIAGAAITALPSPSAPSADPSVGAMLGGVAAGLTFAFAMGVDFPGSNRRFSRLAEV